jgi:hypothetical protein
MMLIYDELHNDNYSNLFDATSAKYLRRIVSNHCNEKM